MPAINKESIENKLIQLEQQNVEDLIDLKLKQTEAELRELDLKHFIHPSTPMKTFAENGPTIIFTKGEGIHLTDINGRKYIDGLSSLWNVNVGHGRSEIGEVAMKQMSTLAFSSTFNSLSHEPAIRLAAEIAKWTPGDLNATFFTSGGSDSNDTAFKTIRHYWMLKGKPEKNKIISRKKSYHGISIGSTSATGIEEFRNFTNSLSPNFHYVDSTIEALKEKIETEGADTIAAFISEPVQGAGGVNIPTKAYFKEVRRLCDMHDIIFIADEVITGFGRTGKNFGIENFDVIPDIITIAKGVTSGYAPLGGMIMSDRLYKDLQAHSVGNFFQGYTYSGHPMATAVALKNLEIIKEEKLIENIRARGEQMLEGFKQIQKENLNIIDVRGIGLMGAIQFKRNIDEEPIGPEIVAEALNRGLILRTIFYDNQDTLALAPPFVVTEAEMDELLNILNESIKVVQQKNVKIDVFTH